MRLARQAVRYGLKGGVMTLLNVGVMAVLVEGIGLRPAVAAVVSTLALILVGYQLMNRFVFPGADPPGHRRRLASYYAIILSGKVANYALFLSLLAVGIWYPVAWILGAIVVFVGTFTANRYVWGAYAAAGG